MADPGQWLGPRSMAVSVTPSPKGSDTPIVGSSSVPWTTSGVGARASAGASSGTGSRGAAGAGGREVDESAVVWGTGWSTTTAASGRGSASGRGRPRAAAPSR